jgi:hypothetical protein
MDGSTVKEMADRFRAPAAIDGLIARPSDWVLEDPAALVKPGPLAKPLTVATLGAVRDYLSANKDALDLATLVVHVASPIAVWVGGPLDRRSRAREWVVSAAATDVAAEFLDRFMSLEAFLIGLQVRFADTDDRRRLLALLSNVKHETVKTAMDDGVTQVVQARSGVALVSDVAVPNPVLLCAYRSFREIVQPSALYVLRVQAGKLGGLPEVGLFEADGGAWRLAAVDRVRAWLIDHVPAAVAVLG